MTHRLVAFAHLLAAGKSQSDAYREAYPTKRRRTDKSVWEIASKMAADPRVHDMVEKLREKATQATVFTLADHLRNLHDLSIKALASKDYNAAARAEEARGKAAGFYVQRLEHTGKDGGPIETKQTRDMTTEELRDALVQHGIEPGTAGVTH